ncbi:MAG: pyruvate formate lyase family protein [Bacteroidota bacterium]
MNTRIRELREFIISKKHTTFRRDIDDKAYNEFTNSLQEQELPDYRRAQKRLAWVLEREAPVILQDEKIVFTRTIKKIPEIFTAGERDSIRGRHHIHELGRVSNISSDYAFTIETGLEARKRELVAAIEMRKKAKDEQAAEYLESIRQSVIDLERLVERYAIEAMKEGREDLYDMLRRIPAKGAETFQGALQFFRILHFALWAGGNYHNTIGRFDQYMLKYLERDLENGTLDRDEAYELLLEFFLSFNKDSDLYPGMQQGDNGQSMVLGGYTRNGEEGYNQLSEMCLQASMELQLIDPKINLRVTANTALEIYDAGTELTRAGLGFPQYSNDEVVIQGLVEKGYDPVDAENYVVAACWEYIIPGYGMDVPNIAALSFVKVIDTSIKKYLTEVKSFDSLMERVRGEMEEELVQIFDRVKNIYIEPSPFQSLLMRGCIENARDISLGGKYNNYGIHGTGIATATDSLAAIKKFIFGEKSLSPKKLLTVLEADFEGYEEILEMLKYEGPKMGNDDDLADDISIRLLDYFADLTGGISNERGGNYRPGSGSAMYYLWHVTEIGASADGRRKGEPLSANFSPGLHVKLKGPISIIKSFSKPDMRKIINGGPLTLEIHDSVFRNGDSIRKVSSLVKSYMDLGGQQLQINAVNRDQLMEAKKHPELHKNLIVRVWGWSGYFVELDEEYQDHIIQRVELLM